MVVCLGAVVHRSKALFMEYCQLAIAPSLASLFFNPKSVPACVQQGAARSVIVHVTTHPFEFSTQDSLARLKILFARVFRISTRWADGLLAIPRHTKTPSHFINQFKGAAHVSHFLISFVLCIASDNYNCVMPIMHVNSELEILLMLAPRVCGDAPRRMVAYFSKWPRLVGSFPDVTMSHG